MGDRRRGRGRCLREIDRDLEAIQRAYVEEHTNVGESTTLEDILSMRNTYRERRAACMDMRDSLLEERENAAVARTYREKGEVEIQLAHNRRKIAQQNEKIFSKIKRENMRTLRACNSRKSLTAEIAAERSTRMVKSIARNPLGQQRRFQIVTQGVRTEPSLPKGVLRVTTDESPRASINAQSDGPPQ